MTTTYRIEGLDRSGRWTTDTIGDNNEFATRSEADGVIPMLAQAFERPVSEFRVVEVAGDGE